MVETVIYRSLTMKKMAIKKMAIKKIAMITALNSVLWVNSVCAQTVNGQVKSADGRALSQIVLKVRDTDLSTRTDKLGNFSLDIAPGKYTLDIKGGGFDHFHQEIEVIESQSSDLLITLEEEAGHKLVIRANPLEHTILDMATPAILLGGEELVMKRAGTLGEILQFEPGLSMSSFGPAVARPVIRGLSGSRIQIANNQMIVQDASSTSADHDVGIEPLLANQIEVVKGPATLLYGSGAIGGVVNATDNKINPLLSEETSGGLEARFGDGATGEQALVAAVDIGTQSWNWHFDAFASQSDDLEIPGSAESHRLHELEEMEAGNTVPESEEEHEDEVGGLLENSAVKNKGGSFGATYVPDWGHIGGAISYVDKRYGVPGHAHEEEGADEEEEAVQIDMNQTRYDLQMQINQVSDRWENIFIGYSLTDYEHVELEGAEIGTQFENDAWELKAYAKHNRWKGWLGVWGIQMTERDFVAIGEEAFVPPSITRSNAFFFLEEKESGNFKWELGARWEKNEVAAENEQTIKDSGMSASSGIVYSITKHNKIAANYSRAIRFASVEELYSEGPHLATQSFEIGNLTLDKEVSNNLDISYRFESDNISDEINLYSNQFDDFIYGEVVSESDACVSNESALEAETEGLQLVCYKQQDASFKGIEMQVDFQLGEIAGHEFKLGLLADYTDAKIKNGGYVPRIPPVKKGIVLSHNFDQLSNQLSWMQHDAQFKTSDNELPTDRFNILDFEMAYRIQVEQNDFLLFFKGKNLLDEEARDHASFLKDLAPRVGRNFTFGVRYTF